MSASTDAACLAHEAVEAAAHALAAALREYDDDPAANLDSKEACLWE